MSGIRETLLDLLLTLPAVILAFSVHEMCHGLAAYALGDPTAKNQGRLTLNPIKHLDPIGILMLTIFKFGWAKPVPVNPSYFKKPKLGMALTSLAGPGANIVFGFFASNLLWVFLYFSDKLSATASEITVTFLMYLIYINIGLALFNLIPISPLDGSKVLYALLPEKAYFKILQYERYGMLILLLLLFSDRFFPGGVGFLTILMAVRDWIVGIFFGLIGLYMP